MVPTIRWLIKTADCVGMIQDVVKIFATADIDISSMEVTTGHIFIKYRLHKSEEVKELLRRRLLFHAKVSDVVDIDLQPNERKEKELEAILESTSDGLVSINQDGYINYLNTVAANLFQISAKAFVGKHIHELTGCPEDDKLSSLLKGKFFNNHLMSVDVENGAMHYVCSGRPVLDKQEHVIGAVITLQSRQAAQELVNVVTQSQPIQFENIICTSQVMHDIINIAKKTANSAYSVLIRGETGTGKELFARALHNASNRRHQPFAPINCAALPEALLESELFGYEPGAFSGAARGGKMGLFESANNGTLFLDEFGELSLILQSKLLRALQEGVIRRVGSTKEIPVDVRIIVATNRDLEEMVAKQQFRQDLYYRINVIPIHIPPLRDRKEDIPLLLSYFHNKYCRELNKHLSFSPKALEFLSDYSWPGNVRELQNIILRAIHLASGDTIDVSDLLICKTPSINQPTSIMSNSPASTSLLTNEAAAPLEHLNLKESIEHKERELIIHALKKHGTARGAAREIGLSHTAVLNKIKRYNLEKLLAKRKELTKV